MEGFHPEQFRATEYTKTLRDILRKHYEAAHTDDSAVILNLLTALDNDESQIEALANCIVKMAVRVGTVDGTQPLTGPQILLLGADLDRWIEWAQHATATAERPPKGES